MVVVISPDEDAKLRTQVYTERFPVYNQYKSPPLSRAPCGCRAPSFPPSLRLCLCQCRRRRSLRRWRRRHLALIILAETVGSRPTMHFRRRSRTLPLHQVLILTSRRSRSAAQTLGNRAMEALFSVYIIDRRLDQRLVFRWTLDLR